MKKNLLHTLYLILASLVLYVVFYILRQEDILNPYYTQILILIGINIILAVSLNLIVGFTGQLALGHAGFMSIGGYAAAFLTLKYHLPFPVVLIAGGLMASLIGFLIGLPILKLKGDYLAITTLGFGEIIRVLIVNMDFLGGPRGLSGIPKHTTFAWVYAITILTVLIIYNIINSSHGRAMISVRDDDIAAEAMGINTTKYKTLAFVIAAFFAGIAGALYAHYFMFLDPKSFDFLKSMEVVTFVVFGGLGSLTGSIFSSVILTSLPEVLREFANYRMVIYAASLVILMLLRPQGLMGTKEFSLKPLTKLFRKSKIRGERDAAA